MSSTNLHDLAIFLLSLSVSILIIRSRRRLFRESNLSKNQKIDILNKKIGYLFIYVTIIVISIDIFSMIDIFEMNGFFARIVDKEIFTGVGLFQAYFYTKILISLVILFYAYIIQIKAVSQGMIPLVERAWAIRNKSDNGKQYKKSKYMRLFIFHFQMAAFLFTGFLAAYLSMEGRLYVGFSVFYYEIVGSCAIAGMFMVLLSWPIMTIYSPRFMDTDGSLGTQPGLGPSRTPPGDG